MKKTSSKYLLLIISVVFFSITTFAQAPPDPGNDPMKSDTAKEITTFTGAAIAFNVHSDFLSERKNAVNPDKRSDTLFLAKNDEENITASAK